MKMGGRMQEIEQRIQKAEAMFMDTQNGAIRIKAKAAAETYLNLVQEMNWRKSVFALTLIAPETTNPETIRTHWKRISGLLLQGAELFPQERGKIEFIIKKGEFGISNIQQWSNSMLYLKMCQVLYAELDRKETIANG